MVGEFLLDIYIHLQRSSPESTNSMGFFNLAACGLPEEQKNGKANEQFKEVAIETVTRRFQWICWKIRPMATRWRLKKNSDLSILRVNTNKNDPTCVTYLIDNTWKVMIRMLVALRMKTIYMYIMHVCLNHYFSAILMFWGTSVLFMLFCSYNNLTQTKKNNTRISAFDVQSVLEGWQSDHLRCWYIALMYHARKTVASFATNLLRDWSIGRSNRMFGMYRKPVCEKKIQANLNLGRSRWKNMQKLKLGDVWMKTVFWLVKSPKPSENDPLWGVHCSTWLPPTILVIPLTVGKKQTCFYFSSLATHDTARELNGSWTGWSCDTQKWKILICVRVLFCRMLPWRVNKAISELYTTFLVHLHTKKRNADLEIYLDMSTVVPGIPAISLLWLIKWRTDFSSPEPSTDRGWPGRKPPQLWRIPRGDEPVIDGVSNQKPNETKEMNQWRPRKHQTENLTFNFLRKRNRKTKSAASGRIHGTWNVNFTYIKP